MKQYLRAKIQAASQSEIEGIVDPLRLAQLKKIDPDPTIRVYSLGHEGPADLNLPGIGRKTLTWIQAAVQWVAEKLVPGTAVFEQHDPNTNSHEGRTKIGEVVGKTLRHIGDHVNALAAIYILPAFKSRPLDFASIEAEIEYADDGLQAWPTAIKNVSGIALGNSDIDSPGIPGATLMGAVQAYAVQAFAGEKGDNNVDKSEVIAAAKDLGMKPTEVFSVDEIMGDAKVAKQVSDAKKNVIAGSERITKERDEAKERIVVLENEKSASEKALNQFKLQSRSSELLAPILADPERKLDDQTKAFINRNLKNFTTEATDEEGLKVDLNKFIDSSQKEYEGLKTDIFKTDENAVPNMMQFPADSIINDQNQPHIPAAPASPVSHDEVLQAEQNPDVNPLIPGGKAAAEALKT